MVGFGFMYPKLLNKFSQFFIQIAAGRNQVPLQTSEQLEHVETSGGAF